MSDILPSIGNQLQRCILPAIIIIGITGNCANIAVLTRRTLYHHACSRYFLILAVNNLLYASFNLMIRLLSKAFQINPNDYSNFSCKSMTYITTLVSFLSPYLIVCASFDRYCASSINARMRKLSSVRVATWLICFVIIVFALIFINILYLSGLQPEKGLGCVTQAYSLYTQVYIIIQVFLFAVIPPSLMTIFGLLTIRNSHRMRVTRLAASRYNRTEHQLARMLFLQVSVHIVFTLPSSVIYLLTTLPNVIVITPTISFVSTVCQILFNCSYVSPFFLYLLSGRIYRKELVKILNKIPGIHCGNIVEPLNDQKTVIAAGLSMHPVLENKRQQKN